MRPLPIDLLTLITKMQLQRQTLLFSALVTICLVVSAAPQQPAGDAATSTPEAAGATGAGGEKANAQPSQSTDAAMSAKPADAAVPAANTGTTAAADAGTTTSAGPASSGSGSNPTMAAATKATTMAVAANAMSHTTTAATATMVTSGPHHSPSEALAPIIMPILHPSTKPPVLPAAHSTRPPFEVHFLPLGTLLLNQYFQMFGHGNGHPPHPQGIGMNNQHQPQPQHG